MGYLFFLMFLLICYSWKTSLLTGLRLRGRSCPRGQPASRQSAPGVFLWPPSFSEPEVEHFLQPLPGFSSYVVSSEQQGSLRVAGHVE